MNLGALLFGAGLLLVTVAWTLRPLFQSSDEPAPLTDDENPLKELYEQREAIYTAIRELDFDYQTGKIAEEDYKPLRDQYVAQGVEILKRIDELTGGDGRAALEAEIERQVAALRRQRGQPVAEPAAVASSGGREPTVETSTAVGPACPSCGHRGDPGDRFCSRCGTPLPVCSQCGSPLDSDDRFCARCGAPAQ